MTLLPISALSSYQKEVLKQIANSSRGQLIKLAQTQKVSITVVRTELEKVFTALGIDQFLKFDEKRQIAVAHYRKSAETAVSGGLAMETDEKLKHAVAASDIVADSTQAADEEITISEECSVVNDSGVVSKEESDDTKVTEVEEEELPFVDRAALAQDLANYLVGNGLTANECAKRVFSVSPATLYNVRNNSGKVAEVTLREIANVLQIKSVVAPTAEKGNQKRSRANTSGFDETIEGFIHRLCEIAGNTNQLGAFMELLLQECRPETAKEVAAHALHRYLEEQPRDSRIDCLLILYDALQPKK